MKRDEEFSERPLESSYGGEFRRRDAVMQAGPKYWPKERASRGGVWGSTTPNPWRTIPNPYLPVLARVAGATLLALSYITFLRPFPNYAPLLPLFSSLPLTTNSPPPPTFPFHPPNTNPTLTFIHSLVSGVTTTHIWALANVSISSHLSLECRSLAQYIFKITYL